MPMLRSPICCVLGHINVGKTKFLDKLRNTTVQLREAGGITQSIRSTYFSPNDLKILISSKESLKSPGILFIDTPGHDCFVNTRIKAIDICDIAIVLVDIMKGFERQTIECIKLLKEKRKPFVIALNKIDIIEKWVSTKKMSMLKTCLKKQSKRTLKDINDYANHIICQLATLEINGALSYKNKHPKSFVSMVPISSITGEGIPSLLLLIHNLTRKFMKSKLAINNLTRGYILEINKSKQIGDLHDIILVNGELKEKDKILFRNGKCSEVKNILLPDQRNNYSHANKITASKGALLKLTNRNIIGSEFVKFGEDLPKDFFTENEPIKRKYDKMGVHVHAESNGALDALWILLKDNDVPVAGMEVGPINKKTVLHASQPYKNVSKKYPKGDTIYYKRYAVIIMFGNYTIDKYINKELTNKNIYVVSDNVIHRVIEKYKKFIDSLNNELMKMYPSLVPKCELRILDNHIYLKKDPFLFGVKVLKGTCIMGMMFETKGLILGRVVGMEKNDKQVDVAEKNDQVCIKIEKINVDHNYAYGTDFDHGNTLITHYDVVDLEMFERYPNAFNLGEN